jgi:two-component system cell cycle response regulator
MMVAQILFMINIDLLDAKTPQYKVQTHLFLACNLLIVILMVAAELWLRYSKLSPKYGVVSCGFLVSYLMYFVIEPFVDGAQMTLMMPIMVALIYFDRKLLFIMGVFSIVFYAGVYFGLERIFLHKPLLEFLLVECVFIVFVVMAIAVLIRAREARVNLERLTKAGQDLMVERAISDKLLKIDALTGLYNHKTFHEYLDTLLEQCESNNLHLQLALFDIDNFKQVNDTYGHWVGDLVLKAVADKVGDMIELNDFAARYGGEEFAVIFTDKSYSEAYKAIEELRINIARIAHLHAGNKPITVSIGICDYQRGDGKEILFRKTDNALYAAKNRGKNTVVSASDNEGDGMASYG